MQNIQQDQQKVGKKRRRYLPMVELVASIARYQLKHRRYFIIENPQTSRIWYLKCMQQLFSDKSQAHELDALFTFRGSESVMRPIFRRCKNFSSSVKHDRELIKTFIRYGYKGIVIKQWSSRPIACFVRGGPSARMELDTFPPGARIGEPHSECSDVSSELKEMALIPNTKFRPRIAWQPQEHPCLLNPRSTLDRDCQHAPPGHGRDKEIVVLHIEQRDEFTIRNHWSLPHPSFT